MSHTPAYEMNEEDPRDFPQTLNIPLTHSMNCLRENFDSCFMVVTYIDKFGKTKYSTRGFGNEFAVYGSAMNCTQLLQAKLMAQGLNPGQ